MSQPLTSELARRWRLDVDTADSQDTPTWVQVRGMAEFTPKVDAQLEDDNDYDSNGWGSQTKTMLSWSNELTLIRKTNPATSAFDPGQEKIRLAHDQFGETGQVHCRWYDRNGLDEAYEGWAQVQWEPEGGEPGDLDQVKVTLVGNGIRTAITNPAA